MCLRNAEERSCPAALDAGDVPATDHRLRRTRSSSRRTRCTGRCSTELNNAVPRPVLAGLPEHLDRRCRPRCRRRRPSTRRRRPTSCARPSRTPSRVRGSCRDRLPDTDTGGRRGVEERLDDGTAEIARQRYTRRQEGRAQARAAARGPGGDHHARGRRVPDPLRVLALAEQGGPAQAERQPVHLVRQLRHGAVQPDLVDGVRRHPVHHRHQRVPRAGVRDDAGDRHAPHDRRPRAGAHLGAGALRDRHRGRRVLLALRLDRGPGLPDARADRRR